MGKPKSKAGFEGLTREGISPLTKYGEDSLLDVERLVKGEPYTGELLPSSSDQINIFAGKPLDYWEQESTWFNGQEDLIVAKPLSLAVPDTRYSSNVDQLANDMGLGSKFSILQQRVAIAADRLGIRLDKWTPESLGQAIVAGQSGMIQPAVQATSNVRSYNLASRL